MSGTPPDLSTFKPVAGQPLAAAQIANGLTAIETWATNAIDPASMLQKGATTGQGVVWDGTKWAPGTPATPSIVAPTMLGPTLWPNSSIALGANVASLTSLGGVIVPTSISRITTNVVTGGSTGNVDVGVYYSDDEATFTRLVSKGSTATPANGVRTFTISTTVLTPVIGRRWYLAIACDNATPQFPINTTLVLPPAFSKASSFPLPSSLTGMSSGTSAFSLMAMV